MRINNSYVAKVTVDNAGQTQRKEPAGQPIADRLAPHESFHTPSTELAKWLNQVQDEPEIRDEVVARVAERLAAGDYLTPNSAEQTAEAMLNAQEEP